MVKILSRAGVSLASAYDVKGSIAGVEQLESREVSLVHEMGATMFSERMSGFIRRVQSGAVLQNATFDAILSDLPGFVWRVLGVQVLASINVRVSSAMVALRDPIGGREIPIFVWDSTNDAESVIRIVENGGAAANQFSLIPNQINVPTLGVGGGQPQRVDDIALRGQTLGFGAGTVTVTALIYLGFAQVGGLSSLGLPLPAW